MPGLRLCIIKGVSDLCAKTFKALYAIKHCSQLVPAPVAKALNPFVYQRFTDSHIHILAIYMHIRREWINMLRNFKLHVEKDYPAMSQKAAEIFAESVNTNPTGAFGFATGSSPMGMYEALVKLQESGKTDLTRITAFNLDEYYPIRSSDPQSYCYFMRENLFDAIGLPLAQTHIPNGEAPDPIAECAAYDEKIANSGGIDTQILGIGTNGHIGFNEPAGTLMASTGYVPLAAATINANAKNFVSPDDVPRYALTMGMHGIMMARRIILLASGESKADILREALCGPITTVVPASLLQLHRDVTIVVDQSAAKYL